MSTLGIYFGPQIISLVEVAGRKQINSIQFLHSIVSPAGAQEEKVPEEVKLVTVLKDELRKNKIEAKDAVLSLSGKDLIIRTFDMPIMPRQELESAVKFEAKKYIPFKIEEMNFDFQWKIDKITKKARILFVGIKKETLDKYIYVINQLNLKVSTVEYSAFSILRVLSLANLQEKGIIAVINADLKKEDEGNFVVLEDGFPLFSRDITVSKAVVAEDEKEDDASLTRFKREVKVSIDYYERKFPFSAIAKIFFITEQASHADLNALSKEMGLPAQFIDAARYITLQNVVSAVSFIKSYSAALTGIKIAPKTNLFLSREKAVKISAPAPEQISLWKQLKLNLHLVVFCALVTLGVYAFGLYRILPVKKDLQSIKDMRPKVMTIPKDAEYDKLKDADADYKTRIETIDALIKNQLYVTELLDAIPRAVSKDTQLVSLSFDKQPDKIQLIIEGNIFLGSSEKELEQVNSFVAHLKEDFAFNKYAGEISLDSIDHPQKGTTATLTHFVVSCRAFTKEKR